MKLPKPVGFLLRLGVTAGAAYLALSQVKLHDILPLLLSIAPSILLLALLLSHGSQILNGLRTRYYLHCHGIDFPVGPALRLHYVGGLFNSFLPGGAGGDAYKAWWLKRHKKGKLLNMVKLMIAARLNGMWAMGVVICLAAASSAPIRALIPHVHVFIPAALVSGTVFYALVARYIFREPYGQQIHAGYYSLVLQALLALTAYVLSIGLGEGSQAPQYVTMFMLSCFFAMLPISIGGVGVRELVLLYGSRMLGLPEEKGVTLAFTFTILALTVPLIGAVIHNFFAPEGKASHAA